MPAIIRLAFVACLLVFGSAISATATAALHETGTYMNPASACQLSIPTTDTQVRPKATGFRNESTNRSAYVICGYGLPASDRPPSMVFIQFHSMDGLDRTINCTGVTGIEGSYPPIYSTKTTQSTAGGDYTILAWQPDDFGGTSYIPWGYQVSITCTLPPQTSITMTSSQIEVEIGT